MIKKILLGLVIIVVLLLVVIALQSSTYHVERTATINAPAPVVFAQVNDFHKWNAWSPGRAGRKRRCLHLDRQQGSRRRPYDYH